MGRIPCVEGCNGKRRYDKHAEATAAAMRLTRKDGDRMMVYDCTFGGFHVGHVNPREGRRRKELKAEKGKRSGIVSVGLPVPSNRARKGAESDRQRRYDRKPKRYYSDDVYYDVPEFTVYDYEDE